MTYDVNVGFVIAFLFSVTEGASQMLGIFVKYLFFQLTKRNRLAPSNQKSHYLGFWKFKNQPGPCEMLYFFPCRICHCVKLFDFRDVTKLTYKYNALVIRQTLLRELTPFTRGRRDTKHFLIDYLLFFLELIYYCDYYIVQANAEGKNGD